MACVLQGSGLRKSHSHIEHFFLFLFLLATGLRGEANRLANTHGKDYCGSCYGGEPPESGCCNTCDEVREAYVRRGWSFSDPDHIDQCVSEGWSQKIKEQNTEGCNVAGKVHVNKVIGNFHISPGRAFQRNSIHVHDLVPYLAGEGAEHHVRIFIENCVKLHLLIFAAMAALWPRHSRALLWIVGRVRGDGQTLRPGCQDHHGHH